MAAIMIIEDEEDLIELYQLVLEKDGHEFVDPRDAIPGVREIRQPDLIILDEHLPNASGSSFIPWFRAIFPNARILLATADSECASNTSADGVALKPFTLDKFRSSIKVLLSQN